LGLTLWGQDARLEHARQVNLDRAGKLPDFVADEVAVRFRSPRVDPPQWQKVDTIESEIAVRNGRFTREHTLVNGKPWNKPTLPNGVGWSVLFGYELKAVFDPACHNDIQYAAAEERNGKSALLYTFRAASGGCFGNMSIKNGSFSPRKVSNPPRFGRFAIDNPGGNLLYFEVQATEFPKDFPSDPFKEIDTWDYVKIGDTSWLLPTGFETYGGAGRSGLWHVGVEYKNHRHFESSTNITFK
jgi:hypothetical protein